MDNVLAFPAPAEFSIVQSCASALSLCSEYDFEAEDRAADDLLHLKLIASNCCLGIMIVLYEEMKKGAV